MLLSLRPKTIGLSSSYLGIVLHGLSRGVWVTPASSGPNPLSAWSAHFPCSSSFQKQAWRPSRFTHSSPHLQCGAGFFCTRHCRRCSHHHASTPSHYFHLLACALGPTQDDSEIVLLFLRGSCRGRCTPKAPALRTFSLAQILVLGPKIEVWLKCGHVVTALQDID